MTHVNIGKVHPDAYRAMEALAEQAAADAREAGLAPTLIELVNCPARPRHRRRRCAHG
ncbi:hypothetical protein [Microbacterium sp. TWP3-1-2b2]|uniref:hypothetical protein n=1 Tax=Microbacterium sp. TWP3-1-2b2 TaxID=2804651 RepID=UPI003CEA3783